MPVIFGSPDTGSGGDLARLPSGGNVSNVAISPDGTRVAFGLFDGGIQILTVGAHGAALTVPTPGVQLITWTGNEALAYVPITRDCAVERVMLTTSATRCLLPTATLQSQPAPNGASWQVIGVSGAGDSNLLALAVSTAAGTQPRLQAIGVLDPSAEATPFRVLTDTVASNLARAGAEDPVLLDRGARVAYVQLNGQTPVSSTVLVVPITGGAPTKVTSRSVTSTNEVGLGATSG